MAAKTAYGITLFQDGGVTLTSFILSNKILAIKNYFLFTLLHT
jgi:hypothetical protein